MAHLRTFLLVGAVAFAGAQLAAQSGGEKAPAKKPSSTAAAAGDAKKGKEVYQTYCAICHYSVNNQKKIGPGLKALYKRGKYADGKKVDDASLKKWIEKGGVDMPAFEGQLSDTELRDLLAFLRTV
jgi:mono/diheme cytochrome c family protein